MSVKRQVYFLYTVTFILAACSILYGLLIAQAMSILAASTVVRYSLTIGIYLAAMGIGVLLCNKIYKGKQDWIFLFRVEILLSIAGGLSVINAYLAHAVYSYMHLHNIHRGGVILFFLLSFVIITVIGFLTGLELPLLIRAGNKLKRKKITNRVLGADYIGALAGGVFFPLLLLPYFEIVAISFVVALVNLFVALVILFVFLKEYKKIGLKLAGAGFLIFVFMFGLVNSRHIQQYFLKRYYYYDSLRGAADFFKCLNDFPEIERFSSPYQKIDIVKGISDKNSFSSLLVDAYTSKYTEDPDYPRDYYLFLNGDYQFCSDVEEIYHEYFAHIPIILNGRVPKKVLVLGGGDGLLNRELLKYPGIKSITHVDLDKKMVDIAGIHQILKYMNKGSLDDERVKIIIADAYQYVKNTRKKYDAVYIDFPNPVDYNLSKLYSREFYFFVGKRLNEEGFIALDSPGIDFVEWINVKTNLIESEAGNWEIYYNTLKTAGFRTVIPYVSVLETDNQRARDILNGKEIFIKQEIAGKEVFKRTIEGRRKVSVIRQLIQIYTQDLQKGFIMAKKIFEDVKFEYKEPGVELYVLNEKRFKLAFSLPYKFSEKIKSRKVNSIMRPVLQASHFWRIRLPY